MRRALAALAVCAWLGLATTARADVRQATLGDVTATLHLRAHAGTVGDLRLTVTRAGATVFSGPITTAGGRPGTLERTPPVRTFLGVVLGVLDLDGDGVGDAVVDLDERGAYCCSHTVIVGADAGGTFRPTELDWGSFGSAPGYAHLKHGFAIVSRDARLDERYTPHALSFEPRRIWYWHACTVQDISKEQPLLVRGDLMALVRTRRQLLARKDHATLDLRGLLTAIAGDRLLIGQRTLAVQSLRADAAAGRVSVSSGAGPTGTAFASSVPRLLARLGY